MTTFVSSPLEISLRSNGLMFSSSSLKTGKPPGKLSESYISLIFSSIPRSKRKKRMMTLLDLPVEITRTILDYLDHLDVVSMLYVCKSLSSIVERHLYMEPYLTSTYRVGQLVSVLLHGSKLRSDYKASYVRRIDFTNLQEDEHLAGWRDWRLRRDPGLYTTSSKRESGYGHHPLQSPLLSQSQKDLPTGYVMHFLQLCTNLVVINLSGLPLASDYFIEGNSRFVSDVGKTSTWKEHEVRACGPKHLFEQMAQLEFLSVLALRDTTWVNKQLMRGFLVQSRSIQWLDLVNAGMVKNAPWTTCGAPETILQLLQ